MNALIITLALLGNEGPTTIKPTLLHTEVDAIGWAFDALVQYDDTSRPFIRLVYLPPYADGEWQGLINFAVNAAAGHGTSLVKGVSFAKGYLLAYDLRALAPDPNDLAALINVWDGIAAEETRFHVATKNIINQTVTIKDERTGRPTDRVVTRESTTILLAPHMQAALAEHVSDPNQNQRVDVLVAQLTNSPGAIYPAEFLLEQLLTSTRGKYPEFRLINFERTKDHSPLVNHQSKRGFFFRSAQDVKGDKGALILNSDVTGKNRLVFATFGLSSPTPMITTFDFKDNKTRPDQQFIRNLIEFEPLNDASEIFVPLPNGLTEYLLADSQGNFQRVAPPDVVTDFNKPDGFTKELEMGISCVICHFSEDGYKTARNDLELLRGSGVDYFGDEINYHGTVLTREQAVDIVVGRFGQRIDEADGILGRARRDLIKAVDSLTDYTVTQDGKSSVQKLGAKLKTVYQSYRYKKIDANQACLELGVQVPEGLDAKDVLKRLTPPTDPGTQEDIMIALLRNGAAIKRDDFEAIYVELARRAIATRASLVGEN